VTQQGSASFDPLALPFDQYQRYRLVAEVADSVRLHLGQSQLRVLDVGGFHRTRNGQALLPVTHFLPSDFAVATDLAGGVPRNYVRASGVALPFGSEAFDLVVTCDTLEHVPAPSRAAFVDELLRAATSCVLLVAPFDSEPTQRAERILREHLAARNCAHGPLEEHFEHGLPSADDLRAQLSVIELSFIEFADGYLPHWLPLMAMQLTPRITSAFLAELNRFYNRHFSPTDRRDPAYRRVFVIAKPGHENLLPAISIAVEPDPADSPLHPDLPGDVEHLLEILRGHEQGRVIRLMRRLDGWRERLAGRHNGR